MNVKDELHLLENTGITINLADGEKKIFFRLALVIVDNLGMHSIFGFTESFNKKKSCRFCLINKSDMNSVHSEGKCKLRSTSNYEADIIKNDSKETGIKEKCVLQNVCGFHLVENLAVDVVHDLLEGICRYDLGLILYYYLGKKLFTLQQIKHLIRGFHYGRIKNKPSEILQIHIKKKKNILLCLLQKFQP